mgnify:CR=1 FL=1
MSSACLFDARATAELLARCVFLLRLSVDLAQRAHATGTAHRVRRALRTARGAQRAIARDVKRAFCIRSQRSARRRGAQRPHRVIARDASQNPAH